MFNKISLLIIGLLLSPMLSALEDEKILKLLLCYNSPNSDYCLAEHINQLSSQINTLQQQMSTQQKLIQNLQKIVQQVDNMNQERANNQQQIQQLEIQLNTKISQVEKQDKTQQKQIKQQANDLQIQQDKIQQQQVKIQRHQEKIERQQDKTTHLEKRLYRYQDNNNGSITDSRSGLIWLKDANCFGRLNWDQAISKAKKLASGQCQLRDGSQAGDWRLPTKIEWQTMIEKKYRYLTLSDAIGTEQWREGDAFFKVQSSIYWAANKHPNKQNLVSYMNIHNGKQAFSSLNNRYYVWFVKGSK